MYMTKRRKVGLIIIILLGLITALIINMLYSSQPLVRWLFVSPKYGEVIFNNYNLQDTLQLAKNYVKEGEGKSAFIVYNYILEKDPDNIEAYIGLADLYRRVSNFKEAERYINEAEKRITEQTSPKTVLDVYYHKALVYDSTFKYDGYSDSYTKKSIEYYNKALHVNVTDKEFKNAYDSYIYYYLGDIYTSLGNYSASIDYYMKSLIADPTDKSIYFDIGMAYIELEDYETAYEYLAKSLEFYKDDSGVLAGLGYYYTEIGEYENALEYLTKAKQVNPEFFSTLYFLGNYYEKTNNLEKEKEYYRKAFEVDKFMIQNKKSQQVIQRLNINVDDLEKEIEKEKEENYSKLFEL